MEVDLNVYTAEFFATCPSNGIRIKYRLRIEANTAIPVERIIAKIDSFGEGFHESIADDLLKSFGGIQVLTADHHGVTIETTRA